MKYKMSPCVFMYLDKFLWQAAEPGAVSESSDNSACQLLQSKTNKRFTEWNDSGGRGIRERNQNNTRGSGRKWFIKRRKNGENIQHLSSLLWKLTRSPPEEYAQVFTWGPAKCKKSCLVELPDKSVIPWTTGMEPHWQQTAWHISHSGPVGPELCGRTQVAERHELAGSANRERSPKASRPHLSNRRRKAQD